MLTDTLIVLDFETTGLDPSSGDRVTEVAAVRIQDNKIVDKYESLANCGVRVPGFITELTGISQQMVDRAPPVKQVVDQLVRFIGASPIVAHNASFDRKFFENECRRSGIQPDCDEFICSLRVSRRVYPQLASHALGSLARSLEIAFNGAAHRAGADAMVTANLMIKIASEIRRRHSHLSIDAQLLRQIMKMPVAQVVAKLQALPRRAEA